MTIFLVKKKIKRKTILDITTTFAVDFLTDCFEYNENNYYGKMKVSFVS